MGYQNLKSEKVEVLNYPGAISSDIIDKTIDVLDAKPESLKVLCSSLSYQENCH